MQAHEYGSTGDLRAHMCTHCRSLWLDCGGIKAAYDLVQREGMLSFREGMTDIWARD
jgi:Zn-finger nucleic acid-binding protein